MTIIRRARPQDAAAIGAVHVAAWRSTYPGILPDAYLANLSAVRIGRRYEAAIHAGAPVFVAAPDKSVAGPRLVGFATAGRARHADLGDGEIETLYVLDDWREQGIGRALMQEAARALIAAGCATAYVWVLDANPNRYFYAHLGGTLHAHSSTRVAGVTVAQTAYRWDPISRLLAAMKA